ncbi:MAG: hypothetical protein GXO76_03125 [Calditrichaeota bacterium]|nr:hypothetical protein [Calditrichota bacterium]
MESARFRSMSYLGIILCLLLLQSEGRANEKKISRFLPLQEEILPWQKDGSFQTYDAAHLQDYLDGGADIYLEYGFSSVGVQAYTNKKGELQVEIFRMTSPEAALGIFSFRRHYPPDSTLEIPNEVSKYDILFQKGRFFVAITNMDGSPETARALRKFAVSILKKIPAEAPGADPFSALPAKGLQPVSEMLIAGPLSMRVRWPLGRLHCFHFERGTTGVTARYKAKNIRFELFVIHPGKRAGFYQLVECFGNIFNATMIVKSNKKIVLAMMNSKKTIFLKKGKDVWIIPNLFDDRPVLNFLGNN